jgi:hypothetical protein
MSSFLLALKIIQRETGSVINSLALWAIRPYFLRRKYQTHALSAKHRFADTPEMRMVILFLFKYKIGSGLT